MWRFAWECRASRTVGKGPDKTTPEVSGLTSGVHIWRAYFFFFFAAFFVAKTLTSLHKLVGQLISIENYTASVNDSWIASKVLGLTFLKRLSRFSEVATEVSGVLPLICNPPSIKRCRSSFACIALFASRRI